MKAKHFAANKEQLRAVLAAALGFTLSDIELFRLVMLAGYTKQGVKST